MTGRWRARLGDRLGAFLSWLAAKVVPPPASRPEPMAGPPRPRVPHSDELPMVAEWDDEPTTGAPRPEHDTDQP